MTFTKIGRYRVKKVLGKGGYGTTFLAFDTVMEEDVALKIFIDVTEGFRSLQREVTPMVSLNHPNIIKYKDCNYFRDDDGDEIFYVATEYAEQGTLTSYSERLSPGEVFECCAQILSGLSECHKHRVIHSDLKPDNIFIKNDAIKIGDFGVSKIGTMVGEALGTFAYMAPEQLFNGKTSRRTDLWAVGVILYQMLYRKLPFKSWDEIRDGAYRPPVTPIPGLPGVEHIFDKALARNEDERYQSCEEFVGAIRAFLKANSSRLAPETDDELGRATSETLPAKPSRFGTRGLVRRYLSGSVYVITSKGRPTRNWPLLENDTAFRIHDDLMGQCYERLGGTDSELGFPSENVSPSWDFGIRDKVYSGRVQWFEGGNIYESVQFGAHPVLLASRLGNVFYESEARMEREGKKQTGGVLGYPISDEREVTSSSGAGGRAQRFLNGYVVASGDKAFAVIFGFHDLYQSIGAWESVLGFPTSDEEGYSSPVSSKTGAIQYFENGCTHWDGLNLRYIYGPLYKRWLDDRERLGFALNSAKIVYDQPQQDFEGGRVKVRDGGAAVIE
jgi:serine/threonine protein kinase